MSYKNYTKRNVNETLRGYVNAALFTGTDESDPSGGEPLDKNYSVSDIAASSLKSMRKDVVNFLRKNKAAVAAYIEHNQEYNRERGDGSIYDYLGHDFWLTRTRSGSGFWDRDYGGRDVIGEKLTEAAHKFSEFSGTHLVVGDDGKLYID